MNRNVNTIGNWIVYIGLALAYLKTSEAMVPYAPRAVLGWSSDWVGFIWAYLAGALVEGVLYVAYVKLQERGKDGPTKWLSGAVAVISVAFSITMNRIDQMVTDGQALSLSTGSPLALLHNVVFLIPLFAALLFMAINVVDNSVPDRGGGKRHGGGNFQRQPYNPPERLEVETSAPDPLSLPSGNGRRQFTSEVEPMPRLSPME